MIYQSPPMTDKQFERFFGYAPRKSVPRRRKPAPNKLAGEKTETPALVLEVAP